ncbi:hypothetical protein AB9M75_04110 [Lactobacillus sp. AN1001]
MKKEVVAPQMVLALRNNPKYDGIHGLAKTMYDCYADRAKCSSYHAKNGDNRFVDKKGVFIYYSNDKMCKILGVSDRTVSKFRKQLVEAGLIDIVRDGLIGYKIYVKDPEPAPENVDWLLKPSVVEVSEENEVSATDAVRNIDEAVKNNIITSQQTEVHSRCENSSVTSRKKHTISDNQESVSQLNNTSETNVTRETGKVEQSSPAAPSQTFEDLALEGLKDRVIQTMGVMGTRVWSKIHMIAQGSYAKANELVETIYKAKSQVAKRVRSICKQYWDLPEISDVAYDSVYFEKNDLLSKGLESALIRIIEIHYKSDHSEIKNLDGFMYTFLRNSISQNVELYSQPPQSKDWGL